MTVRQFLAILATVLFGVALLVVVAVDGNNAKLIQELTLGGLASLAAAHI